MDAVHLAQQKRKARMGPSESIQWKSDEYDVQAGWSILSSSILPRNIAHRGCSRRPGARCNPLGRALELRDGLPAAGYFLFLPNPRAVSAKVKLSLALT